MNSMMDEIDRLVARRVKQERLAAGVTQRELAEAVGVVTQQVQKYEAGVDRIKAGQLWLMAERIGVPIGDLFREDTRPAAGRAQLLFVRALRQVPAHLIEPLAEVVRAMNGRRGDG